MLDAPDRLVEPVGEVLVDGTVDGGRADVVGGADDVPVVVVGADVVGGADVPVVVVGADVVGGADVPVVGADVVGGADVPVVVVGTVEGVEAVDVSAGVGAVGTPDPLPGSDDAFEPPVDDVAVPGAVETPPPAAGAPPTGRNRKPLPGPRQFGPGRCHWYPTRTWRRNPRNCPLPIQVSLVRRAQAAGCHRRVPGAGSRTSAVAGGAPLAAT